MDNIQMKHLGDGIFAHIDSQGRIHLTTQNPDGIILDVFTLAALVEYAKCEKNGS